MKRHARAFAVVALALAGVTGPAAAQNATFDLQGHRGARGLAPENTLAGFTRALEIGVSTLELDCGVTKDGVVVVSHDRLLSPDHTRDASGKFLDAPGPAIVDLTFEELRQYDVGRIKPGSEYAAAFPGQQPVDGERIPRLADVFALVERSGNRTVRFNIETKIDPAHPLQSVSALAFARALAAAIRDAGMAPRTTVQSFDWRTLRLLGALAPEIGLGALTDQQPDEDTIEIGKPGASAWLGELDVDDHAGSVPKLVQALGAKTWSPHARDLTPALVFEAHSLGLAVVPWTVNDPKDMERAIAAGVDGLISDYPDRLRTVLQSKGIAVPAPTPGR
ncbi:MAG TPA: glycerophosphodiester phosphodiesterase [Steroidobacteraceae bacterium]|nr:glycerophosphodiester phosphodiesterase [Steroidobacteraceae bacterium]